MNEIRAERRELMGGLAKGLKVLLAFDQQNPNQTLSEIAHVTGLSPAVTRRCLMTLEDLGYIGRDRRNFFLKPRVLDLSAAYLSALNVERLAMTHLTDLANATHDSASLTVLDGHDIVYLARASTRTILRLEANVGSRFPAFATSMGRVLMAALPDEEIRRRLAASELMPLTDKTETDPGRLFAAIQEARRDGYSVVEDELAYGVVALAVPVIDPMGRTVAAVNSSGHSKRTHKDDMVRDRLDSVREVGKRISDELRRLPQSLRLLSAG
jgi:IclR family transcriptional regulator, pca regulon regulatory protein